MLRLSLASILSWSLLGGSLSGKAGKSMAQDRAGVH